MNTFDFIFISDWWDCATCNPFLFVALCATVEDAGVGVCALRGYIVSCVDKASWCVDIISITWLNRSRQWISPACVVISYIAWI